MILEHAILNVRTGQEEEFEAAFAFEFLAQSPKINCPCEWPAGRLSAHIPFQCVQLLAQPG